MHKFVVYVKTEGKVDSRSLRENLQLAIETAKQEGVLSTEDDKGYVSAVLVSQDSISRG